MRIAESRTSEAIVNPTSPTSLANEQIHTLQGYLGGIFNGEPDSIHDARVATRRLREILSVIDDVSPAVDVEVKRMGRFLGRVRDLDVETDLLLKIERRVPAAGAVTGVARAHILRLRSRQLRKAIKMLEGVDLVRIARGIVPRHPWRQRLAPASPLIHTLRAHTAARVQDVRTAVTHATGVYFPRRSHVTRIALKKLRYAVEIAAASGIWHAPQLLKDLRKFQEVLGQVHDAETLLRSLDSLVADADISPRDVDRVRRVLEGDIADLHAQYLAGRASVLAACDACERFAREGRGRGRLLVAAGSVLAASLAVPAALALAGRRD